MMATQKAANGHAEQRRSLSSLAHGAARRTRSVGVAFALLINHMYLCKLTNRPSSVAG
jgi:hypothetical protein